MKLQHLTVIFIIIMIPIALVLSEYIQIQIDTLSLQKQYDAKLMDATYDAVKAFDMNTSSSNVSEVYDTVRQDILAAVSIFMTSFATNLGIGGTQQEYIKPYIPAILFTLYDGYYIYAPTKTSNGYTYTLQPYNYYSVRYKKEDYGIDVVVNYSLDNYIVVYGYIGTNEYVVRSGYLEVDAATKKNSVNIEKIQEYVPVATWRDNKIQTIDTETPVEVTDENWNATVSSSEAYISGKEYTTLYNKKDYIDSGSAKNYYEEAGSFTKWVKDKLGEITAGDAIVKGNQHIFDKNDKTKIFDISSNNNPAQADSRFNLHRIDVIKNSIEDNLNYVITAYAHASGGNTPTYNFRMPKLTESEWVQIASNISMVSFVQGMPVGSKYYNNYCVVNSTTNKFFVSPENIYFVGDKDNREYYHKIDCPYLGGDNIVGFSNYDFQRFYLKDTDVVDQTTGEEYERQYYRHREKACYYCIVGSNYTPEGDIDKNTGNLIISSLGSMKENAYYTALAREKYRQYKVTEPFIER